MENQNKYSINVYSEIGQLKKVLLHRPGKELENLEPSNLQKLLFDDTPDLQVAQHEHDMFADVLTKHGVEVLYIENLVSETIEKNDNLKKSFLNQYIEEANILPIYKNQIIDYFKSMSNKELVKQMIAGVTKYELGIKDDNDGNLIIDPLPNILFQRDPFASIGNGVTIHHMFTETRRRETLFSDLVLRNHPMFKNKINYWYNRDDKYSLEGGDILVLNNKTLIIGCSQRTSMEAIRLVANRLFENKESSFEKVVAIDLKVKNRAFMHLDTVFTNIDYDKFLAHPLIFDKISEFEIIEFTKNNENKINKNIVNYLSDLIGKKVTLIKCGGDDPIAQGREQWNDGTNVLTIKPGEVIAYSRNHHTIDLLHKNGIIVHIINSSELSRGRGGPRCMSMPIWRENLITNI